MEIIQLQEQQLDNTPLPQNDAKAILPYIEDGKEVVFSAKRGRDEHALCLMIKRTGEIIKATSSYYIGLDWLKEKELAIQVNPKMNDGFEIDYVRMLNDALCEYENYDHLKDLLTIHFKKPSIKVNQKKDLLSIFLITEYITVLQRIVKKGLMKSFYDIEENLKNKIRGRILIERNILHNLTKGRITDNVCRYQVYDIDSPENRILKKALYFCIKQLEIYKHAIDTSNLEKKIRFIKPYFTNVGDEVSIKTIKTYKGNPVFQEYNRAIEFAQLILRRYSYDISIVGKTVIETPPFWIDMSKLFELYIFHHLRKVFTGKKEVQYHVRAHYQELDYLINPEKWPEPYIIDAKYKPRYKQSGGITKDDAREVAGYARLRSIYQKLGLDENKSLPIKCLIIYPDQDQEEKLSFSRLQEPTFDEVDGYVRMYKLGIRLPVIKSN